MGTTIDINHSGIFLVGIEIYGFDKAVVEVGLAVSRLHRAAFDGRHLVVGPRGGDGGRNRLHLARCGGEIVLLAIHSWFAPCVGQEAACGREGGVVHTAAVVEEGALARLDVYAVEVVANGFLGVGLDDDSFVLGVEAKHFDDFKLALGQLLEHLTLRIHEVEMVVAVAAALHDELLAVPRQEDDGIHGLDVARVGFGVQHAEALAAVCVVGHQFGLVLRAGQFKHIYNGLVGTPGYVGEVAVGGVASLEIERLLRSGVVDAHGHLVAGHTCHRVLLGSELRHAVVYIDEREVRHHRLVHAIEGQEVALRTPEEALVDAKLVAVNAHSVLQFAATVFRDLLVVALRVADVEIPAFDVGHTLGQRTLLLGLSLVDAGFEPFHLLALPIIINGTLVGGEGGHSAFCLGEGGIRKVAHLAILLGIDGRVNTLRGQEWSILDAASLFVVEEDGVIDSCLDQTVAPPSGEGGAGHDVPIILAAPHQVVEREGFLLCHSGEGDEEKQPREGYLFANIVHIEI